jgi:hypothetical protein
VIPVVIGVVGFWTLAIRIVTVVVSGIILTTGIESRAGVGGFTIVSPYCRRHVSLFGSIKVVPGS